MATDTARLVSSNKYEYAIKATKTGKLKLKKYDPYTRTHVEFSEKKPVKNKK